MSYVTSKDGTQIAYEKSGQGAPLIVVDGALCYRDFGPARSMAKLLEPHFTVYIYDRRGRGESGNSQSYAVEREVEDIEALIDLAGGAAYVFGMSSGAVLALETAHRLPQKVKKLVVYEAPFIVDDSHAPRPADVVAKMQGFVDADRRGEAVKFFMRIVGTPAPFIFLMSWMPMWSKLKEVAHTLPYDLTILGDTGAGKPLPKNRWSQVAMPTLVADGGKSPTYMRNGQKALAQVLPSADYRTLPGQTHMLKPEAIQPVLVEFFA